MYRSDWAPVLSQKRQLYAGFVDELIISPAKFAQAMPANKLQPTDVTFEDHPLSVARESKWNTFFKDNETLEEIEKDVRRTFPHLHFFNNDTEQGNTEHYESLKRILFLYAKLNPGIKYVQGMNEILGPLYYIFASDPHQESSQHAECDAFFCFTNLMSDVMNNFCKSLDKSEVGINSTMRKLNLLLKEVDVVLWQNMEEKRLDMEFYSFRWLTLILSQEFDLPTILRLWDTIFSYSDRCEILLYICCAMIVEIKEEILVGDFAENLKILQRYPPTDMNKLIGRAHEIRSKHPRIPRVMIERRPSSPLTGSGVPSWDKRS